MRKKRIAKKTHSSLGLKYAPPRTGDLSSAALSKTRLLLILIVGLSVTLLNVIKSNIFSVLWCGLSDFGIPHLCGCSSKSKRVIFLLLRKSEET